MVSTVVFYSKHIFPTPSKMKKSRLVFSILCAVAAITGLSSCTSSIVGGELARLSSIRSPKPETFEVPILSATPNTESAEVIAIVTARAYVLDKAVTELKKQARLAGADALVEFKQERRMSVRMSVDYLQDLYFLEAKAIAFR